jgi:hypothetical protein
MIRSLIEALSRAADALSARPGGRRAVIAANIVLLSVAMLLLYAAGAYAMEHEAKDTAATGVVRALEAVAFLAALAATTVVVTGRPRRLSARRYELGVLGAAVAWPLTCALLLLVAVLSY